MSVNPRCFIYLLSFHSFRMDPRPRDPRMMGNYGGPHTFPRANRGFQPRRFRWEILVYHYFVSLFCCKFLYYFFKIFLFTFFIQFCLLCKQIYFKQQIAFKEIAEEVFMYQFHFKQRMVFASLKQSIIARRLAFLDASSRKANQAKSIIERHEKL